MAGWEVNKSSTARGPENSKPRVKPTPTRVNPLQPSTGAPNQGKRRSKGRLNPMVKYTVSSEQLTDPFAEAERRIAERIGKEEYVTEEEV